MSGLIVFLVLMILVITGIVIGETSEDLSDGELYSGIIKILFGLLLFFHVIFWSLASYDYNLWETKRDAIQETIDQSRKNSNYIENAALIHKKIDINKKIKTRRYNNTIWILDCYIDDRFEELKLVE